MQIEILDTQEQIDALKPDWDELYRKMQPGIFMHHSWVSNNYRMLPPEEIILMAVYADGRKLIGVFPFAIGTIKIKWMTFKTLKHGGSDVTDYSQFIIDSDSNSRLMTKRVLEKLAELQSGRWDFYHISNLSNGIDSSNLFINLALRQFYAGTVSTDITPIVSYQHEYAEAKKISNIKRRFRKIADDCEISYYSGKQITAEHMAKFSELHQRSFPNAGFDRTQTQAYYRALIEDDDFSEHVQLATIEREGELIAAHFGFEDADRFYYYVPTYNETYSTNGPGQYLLWCLINRAKDENKTEFDLLRGCEDYKFNWTNKINTNYTLFGAPDDASWYRRLLVNLWLLTKSLPCFRSGCDH